MSTPSPRVQTVYHYRGRWHVYATKSDGKYHQFLCAHHKGRTYVNPKQIFLEFVPGFALCEPLVIGGTELVREPVN